MIASKPIIKSTTLPPSSHSILLDKDEDDPLDTEAEISIAQEYVRV